MLTLLKKILLKGQIPYVMQIKTVFYWLAWILPFSILLMPTEHGEFAEIGWLTLIGVMAIRPIADILPRLLILRTLTSFRREFGVFAGMMLLAHFVGWMLLRDVTLLDIFTKTHFWEFDGIFLWGIIGMAVTVLVLLTSNRLAIRLLKRNWGRIQDLAYLMVLFGGIHVTLVGKESGLAGIIVVAVLWVLAKLKKSLA